MVKINDSKRACGLAVRTPATQTCIAGGPGFESRQVHLAPLFSTRRPQGAPERRPEAPEVARRLPGGPARGEEASEQSELAELSQDGPAGIRTRDLRQCKSA